MIPDLFFDAGPPPAGAAHPVGRLLHQARGQLGPPAADRLLVEASDLGHQVLAARPEALGLEGDVPAPLSLIQPAEEDVHLPMALAVRLRPGLLADSTLALPNLGTRHAGLPSRDQARWLSVHQPNPHGLRPARPTGSYSLTGT